MERRHARLWRRNSRVAGKIAVHQRVLRRERVLPQERVLPHEKAAIGAVDIGGTKIAVAAIGQHGAILAREEMSTPSSKDSGAAMSFDAAMDRVSGMLERVRSQAGVEFCGIGIGCTGPVDPMTGIVGDVEFLPGWKGCNPVARLAERFQVDAAIENDADAAALGEAQWGAGRGRQNLICVTVGTGIGGGILLNGELYRGVGGAHPEIGHHVIDASGPLCFCGATGCWEVLAAGPAIVSRFLADASRDGGSPLDTDRLPLTAKAICDMARSGNAAALRAVDQEGRYLGIGIANLITLFAPELIVLSGSVFDSADLFLPEIQKTIRRNCGLVPASEVTLVPASLGRDAPLIGAGVVWSHRNREDRFPC
jgi:glucokinase